MESVIATVSGYHGSQRFNLIKLISHAGGFNVGYLNNSVTHLICWKFQGPKYELAKKLKIIIVNHRWIEDSVRQGRRLPETSYTARWYAILFYLCSGKEVGSLLMEIPAVPDKVSNSVGGQSSAGNASDKHVIDIDCEDAAAAAAAANTFPKMERRQVSKLKRRLVNKTTTRSHSSGATCDDETSSRCYYNEVGIIINSLEKLDSSCTRQLRQKKISSYIEPLRKGRRLVRKNVVSDVLGSESEEECCLVHVPQRQDDTTNLSSTPSATLMNSVGTEPVTKLAKSTDFFNGASTSALYASHQIATPKDARATETVIGSAESTDLSNGASASLIYASPDLLATPKDYSEAEQVTRLNKSTDLSCVICWTSFSSTRGVLPCGHRFCFSCIQNWADYMSSSSKISTCPLCKASFDNITKVDDAVSSDQKIYSQTIPDDPSVNIYVLPTHESPLRNAVTPVCGRCSFREPEDMLIRCHLCHTRCVHSYCLDPYMLPWTCSHCKDLRMLYH
ncbi:hypothetical protein DCAR_0208496 [Daucus carota subsp. sativus]|uniref:RING-type E3 ubiquitin transferase BRCA1 n=1 Tax=Daucus carota subsp. sativus TaxID=79200 RepID=A0AAF0WHL4_DAUCS|nr:hypothetical protein DCAR_0208496 [Daucus carota subsp. sativus]